LLPISQSHPDSLTDTCSEETEGGGGQPDAAAKSAISISSHENFIPNGAPGHNKHEHSIN